MIFVEIVDTQAEVVKWRRALERARMDYARAASKLQHAHGEYARGSRMLAAQRYGLTPKRIHWCVDKCIWRPGKAKACGCWKASSQPKPPETG